MPRPRHTRPLRAPLRAPLRLACAAALLAAAPAAGAQVTVTGPATPAPSNLSCSPFSCMLNGQPSTRYQQVYRAAAFPGTIDIGTIEFFLATRTTLNGGTIRLYLSTTAAEVDALSTTNFDANLGAATALFGTYTIGGAAPAVLSFAGTPYRYDPGAGNLLLDVRVVGALTPGSGGGYLARVNAPGGSYSRAHDFGNGHAGYGLETRFGVVTTTAAPEPATLPLAATALLLLAASRAQRRAAARTAGR